MVQAPFVGIQKTAVSILKASDLPFWQYNTPELSGSIETNKFKLSFENGARQVHLFSSGSKFSFLNSRTFPDSSQIWKKKIKKAKIINRYLDQYWSDHFLIAKIVILDPIYIYSAKRISQIGWILVKRLADNDNDNYDL